MKRIPLTQGQFALVDDEDFDRINSHKWCAALDRTTNSYYAARNSPRDADGKQHRILMHREIMNAKHGEQVDHINHDTLDQRRSNLRLCSNSQNHANQRMPSTNKSGFKGVSLDKPTGKWKAQVRANGEKKYIGLYVTAIEAAIAYDDAALKYQGEYAYTNAMRALEGKESRE